jgi:hypothetical protein
MLTTADTTSGSCCPSRIIMHARELLDLASILSAHAPVLIRHAAPLADHGMERYWTAAKCRMDRWGRSLRQAVQRSNQEGLSWHRQQGAALVGLIEEIFSGDVLTRVWTALVCAHERRQGTERAEPLARSVFIGQLEARNRAMSYLLHQPLPPEEAFRLNGLRHRAEHWSDLLVGYLTRTYDVVEFAVEPSRARDFGRDLNDQDCLTNGSQAWPMIQASIRGAFAESLTSASPNVDLNAEIAGGILGCYPPELFDSTGNFRSLWSMRISTATNDAQGMIDQLLALDGAAPPPPKLEPSARRRWFGNP